MAKRHPKRESPSPKRYSGAESATQRALLTRLLTASGPVAMYLRRCLAEGRGVATTVVPGETAIILPTQDAEAFLAAVEEVAHG